MIYISFLFFQISFESTSAGLETPLRFTNTDTSDWLRASVTMPTDTSAIIIDGIIGKNQWQK